MKTTRPRRPVADPPPRKEPHGNPRSTNRNPRTHERRSVLPHMQDGRRRLPPRTVPGPDRNPNLRDCLHGATQRMVRRLTKHEVPRHARRNGSRPLGVLPDCRSMERDVSAQLRVPKDEPPPVPRQNRTHAVTRVAAQFETSLMYHNFGRVHSSLGKLTTPAMAAGVSDHVW